MLELFVLFLLIMLPTGAIIYTTHEQQTQAAHRQFIARRIGNQVSVVEQVRRQSASLMNQSLDRLMEQLSKGAFLQGLLEDIEFSDISKAPRSYLLWQMALPVMVAIAMVIVQMLPVALIALLYAGVGYLRVILGKRGKLNKSLNQLPDLIAMISNSLKAGNSLFACFSFAAEEMPQPTRQYFNQLYTELQYGIPFKQASYKMLKPLNSIPEYCMFVSAVNIQRESGGNLSEVLEILSTTIRERLKMKAKISALTGQSRLTGYVIGAAPTMMLLGLSVFNYKFVEPLYVHPTGKLMLGIAVVMQIIGFIVIKKIVDIRV
jgi:tight adherence protein B